MIISQVSYRTNGPLVFSAAKIKIKKEIVLYNILAHNMDCGYMLELPCRIITIFRTGRYITFNKCNQY